MTASAVPAPDACLPVLSNQDMAGARVAARRQITRGVARMDRQWLIVSVAAHRAAGYSGNVVAGGGYNCPYRVANPAKALRSREDSMSTCSTIAESLTVQPVCQFVGVYFPAKSSDSNCETQSNRNACNSGISDSRATRKVNWPS